MKIPATTTTRIMCRPRRIYIVLLLITAPFGILLYSRRAPGQRASADAAEKAAIVQGSNVREFGAVGDGISDDTAAIQKAVNSRAGEIQLPRGEYRITAPILVDLDRFGPTSFVANGPTRIVMDGPGPALRFVGTHRGTANPSEVDENVWENQRMPMVVGLEIIGAHPKANGIEATGTMQLIVTRVAIRNALHGIHLTQLNRNVIISDCHIYDNHGVGIYYDAVNLHQSNIVGCHVSYNDGGGVVIRGGDVRNVHIGTCDIEGNMGGPDSKPTANVLIDSTGGSIGEIAIVGCTIQHEHTSPDSANIRINGQSAKTRFTDELRHGNITIADNILSDVQVNVDIANTRGITITGNTFWQGFAFNLRVANTENAVVANNVFDRNPRDHSGDSATARLGLLFSDCRGCTLTGNHIHKVGDIPAAVTLRRCVQFNVSDCAIFDCSPCGLLMEDVSYSRVSDCLIRDDGPDESPRTSLRTRRGRGNMIVDNLLGHASAITDTGSRVAGNYSPDVSLPLQGSSKP